MRSTPWRVLPLCAALLSSACGDDESPCRAVACAARGACVVTDGVAACRCEPGYGGATCDGCATGYQQNALDGVCRPGCDLADLDCGPHGRCDDRGGAPACACDRGYAGTTCMACAAGYQDRDDDGTCRAGCDTARLDCGAHGACDDAGGTAACACDPGHVGDDCTGCDDGYQDHDGDGTCARDCATAALDCGAHGACDDAGGTAACACDPGYAGPACAACAAGYQDHDDDGQCAPDCTTAALDCGAHGACDDASGAASCACDLGHVGAACAACAAGYQDQDGDGACAPDCATAALACAAHSHCSDAGGTAACVCDEGHAGAGCATCAAGYQDTDGDGTCRPTCATLGWTCSDHGSCTVAAGAARCACDGGFVDDGAGHCLAQDGRVCLTAIPLALATRTVSGTTTGAGADYSGTCQRTTGAEVVYRFEAPQPVRVRFHLSGFDSVLYVRRACTQSATEVACDDDSGGDGTAALDLQLDAGTYYLFADGYQGAGGPFVLEIEVVCAAGTIHDPASGTCVPDPCLTATCAAPHRSTCVPVPPTSHECQCDPGYLLAGADCVVNPNPTGASCADPLPLTASEGQVTGSTGAAHDNGKGTCGGLGPDLVYGFTLATRTRVDLAMTGAGAVLHLRRTCASPAAEVACDRAADAAAIVEHLDPGTYFVFVDSYVVGADYTLTYSFRTDPCAGDPCPGTPECVAAADWSGHTCVCPEGTLPYDETCVPDPCLPNPCDGEHRGRCAADLPASHLCLCNLGYVEDAGGVCVADPAAKDWTILVYLNADNNLESYGYDNLAQMQSVGSSDAVNLVLLFDSSSQDGGASRYLYVTSGGATVVQDLGEVDMSDWRTLAAFGAWAVAAFPARHYALDLWDHGAGWQVRPERPPLLKGFSSDDHGTAGEIRISNGDYARALQAITATLGDRLDLVGFDACLMGMFEVADATAPYARVFVASQETIPAAGWSYDGFLGPLVATPSMTAVDLGAQIVESYHHASTSNSTLAMVDLDEVTAMHAPLSAFADALRAHPELAAQVESARQATQDFYGIDEYRDLWDFASRVRALAGAPADLTAAADALIAQLGATILLSRAQSSHPGAHGLSIYLPSRTTTLDPAYVDSGAVWSQHTTWDEFLQGFTE